MNTKDKYIHKLEELIKWIKKNTVVVDYIEAKDYIEYRKLESELSSLKAEIKKEENEPSQNFGNDE